MNKKKILIINHYAGAPKYGMEFRHYNIAKELVNRGYETCIIASSFSHLRKTPELSEDVFDGVKFKWIKTPTYKNYGIGRLINMVCFSLRFLVTKLPFNPDFVIVSSPSPFPILNAIRIKNKYKAKLIYEIRDVWPQSIIDLNGTSPNHPIIKYLNWLDTLGIKKSDFILSPLSNIGDYIQKKGFHKKVVILPNGISEYMEYCSTDSAKDGKFTVGYGGTIGDSNSIMNLLKSAKLLKQYNINFEIVGNGSRFDDVKKYVNKYKLENVKLYGRLSQNEMFTILKKCDILYNGNPKKNIYKYGISSIKIAEYLLLKKPIIDASYGTNVIRESGSGISVPCENPNALVEGIIKMKNMSERDLTNMGTRGFDFALKNYLYTNSVEKLIKELQ